MRIETGTFEPDPEVCDAVTALLDTVLESMPYSTGETFIARRACGEVDGHTDTCFVPALRRWQTAE